MMDSIIDYITNPSSILSFIVFVFWLGATWSSLNGRLKDCEKRLEKLEEADLGTKLAEILTDIQWIKSELQKMSK